MSLIKYTAEIVKSYVFRNEIDPQEIPELIDSVYRSLHGMSGEPSVGAIPPPVQPAAVPAAVEPTAEGEEPDEIVETEPFVPIDQAVSHDAVICLICGKPNKAIKGHLSRTHGMDIKTYSRRFSLPKDFPMVAPSYSEKRRQLAIEAGLGEKLREGRKKKMTEP